MRSFFRRLKVKRLLWLSPLGILALLLMLFCVNGLLLGSGESPQIHSTGHPTVMTDGGGDSSTIRIMAFNIAKCFAHHGGLSFADTHQVEKRLKQIAVLIKQEQPDLVFLSETITECGPCPVNQVEFLAESTGMSCWGFGENYNFGLPFYRVIGGNAILSRLPLSPAANPSLPGRRPFYMTRNNRRALWCSVELGGESILLCSVHTDSFNPENNLRQTQALLEFAAARPAVLAGDFNARPEEPSVELLRAAGSFSGVFDSPPTFPADNPDQAIDFIFAPASWQLLEHRVLDTQVSDHRPVVALFRVAR